MTRSIFDPTGDETERSGSPFLGPDAANISHMPPDVIDGEVGKEDDADAETADQADELPQTLATDSAEAARRLAQMSPEAPGEGQPLDEVPPPTGA